MVTLITDCFAKDTNFLHALLFFLCFIENAVFGYLIYLYYIGEVLGDRSLTLTSLVVSAFLNFIFIIIHQKKIMKTASGEYM